MFIECVSGGSGVAAGECCPLPNPPPLRGRGDCRCSANLPLSREAGEGGTRGAAVGGRGHEGDSHPHSVISFFHC
ncbi:hypothetical protein FZ983_13585 [Azospirillum sp. B21]|nr:hypothetical protein FZ983_13585 [Azospirillum sp. B21]